MSVVNKMLRDLEARQAADTTMPADYQAPERRLYGWWVIILCLIGIAGGGYWLINSVNSPLMQAPLMPVALLKQSATETKKPESKTMLVAEINTRYEQAKPDPKEAKPSMAELQNAPNLVSTLPPPDVQKTPQGAGAQPTDQLGEAHTLQAGLAVSSEAQIVKADATPVVGAFRMQTSSQLSHAASLRANIKEALANNHYPLAIQLLSTLLEQEPDNYAAVKRLAALLFANNYGSRAITLLLSNIQRSPLRGDLRLMLARLYVQKKNQAAAWSVMNEIEPEPSIQTDYWAYRANLAQQLGDYAAAKRDYLALTNSDANKASWWLGLGIVEEKLGAYTLARTAYQKALSLAQLDAQVSEFIEQRLRILVGTP